MLKPLEEWICDNCGQVIESAEEGWLERLCDKDGRQYDFKIVHHREKCRFHKDVPRVRDMHLNAFVGQEGIAVLLSLLDPDLIASPDDKGPVAKDLRELAELFRRLHVPYYEEARHYMARAKSDGLISSLDGLHLRNEPILREIIEVYSTVE